MEWIERYLAWLTSHPRLVIAAGKALFGLATFMMFLGLMVRRFGNRVDRAAERANTTALNLVDSLPWPIQMLTPETAGGWVVVAVIAGTGLYLVGFGKWLKRQY